jgi:hypothetical protein
VTLKLGVGASEYVSGALIDLYTVHHRSLIAWTANSKRGTSARGSPAS